jgi:hypothetical protein
MSILALDPTKEISMIYWCLLILVFAAIGCAPFVTPFRKKGNR